MPLDCARRVLDLGVRAPRRGGRQVLFYGGDYERQLQDVLHGNIVAAVVTSGFLDEKHADVLSDLRILGQQARRPHCRTGPLHTAKRI